jgi:hypothetical protein
MKKYAKRLTLHKETLRFLAGEPLHNVAAGYVTQNCPCTQTCGSCFPCTLGDSCVSGDPNCTI